MSIEHDIFICVFELWYKKRILFIQKYSSQSSFEDKNAMNYGTARLIAPIYQKNLFIILSFFPREGGGVVVMYFDRYKWNFLKNNLMCTYRLKPKKNINERVFKSKRNSIILSYSLMIIPLEYERLLQACVEQWTQLIKPFINTSDISHSIMTSYDMIILRNVFR